MKSICVLKRSALAVAICAVVLCAAGCSKPMPKQVEKNTELLCEAIENDNLEQAKECIRAGADVNAKDDRGWTALRSAMISGNKDIIELLKAAGAKE